MMVFTVRDSQAEASMRPMFFEKDAVAIRSFKLSVGDGESSMSNSPEDFTLYRIGYYDDEKMQLEGCDPVRLMNGLEAVSDRQIDQAKIKALHKEIERINLGEKVDA